MNRILIAPNSFKDCAYSTIISKLIFDSITHRISNKKNDFDLVQFPISDGGDGFLEVIKFHFKTETKRFKVNSHFIDGLDEYTVEYSQKNKTVYIESAKIIGLNLVPAGRRNPVMYNSASLGDLLLQINSANNRNGFIVDNVIIGIGGTAVNDLGAGILSLFGLKLFDASGLEMLPIPKNFNLAEKVTTPKIQLSFNIQIVTDVENPLLGENGSTKVFAEQKGAGKEEILMMEKGFIHLLNLLKIEQDTREALSGAGGGTAAAFQLFFNASNITGREFIINRLGIAENKSGFQLIITGEGKLDNQSLLNKGAMIIADFFRNLSVQVCFICGENNLNAVSELLDIFELKAYFENKEESIRCFPEGISNACGEIVNKYF